MRAVGNGVFNAKTERSRVTLEMGNPFGGPSMEIVEITDGEVDYASGDLVAKALPPGKEWVRTDGSDPEEDETPLNIEDSMEMLDSSGEVRLLGREAVNGTMTRHYRGEIQLDEFVDFLREKGKDAEADAYERIANIAPTGISAEGWVDDENLLRRLRMVLPMPDEEGEPPVTVDMRMDFFDYGAEPDIALPDPDSVVEGPLGEGAPAAASVS